MEWDFTCKRRTKYGYTTILSRKILIYNPQNHRFGFSKRSVHFPEWKFKTKRTNFKKTQMPFKCFLSSV